MNTRACLWIALLLSLGTAPAHADESFYDLLSRDTVGADDFTRAHPTWDGRGVVIAILDTGVDPSVPGLRLTSTGETKVIETRDFSGEGDVPLEEATIETADDGAAVLRTSEGVVRGHDRLGVRAKGDRWWLGFFEEQALQGSRVRDVNLDGQMDDRFAVVVFEPAEGGEPQAVIDLDGNGSIQGEQPMASYRVDRRWFRFSNPDPREDQTPVAFTQTVLLDTPGEEKVELHFDDGGHGTHCAGIATGQSIQGRDGFDGIAPGAWVMSLKIGHNALAGGATTAGSKKDAIAYASKWARDHKVPVVMNISYGIGSEMEGRGDIDAALDEALAGNRWLVASVSAGNEGPGLSTVGTPAAADFAWTAGAGLTPGNSHTLYAGGVKRLKVFSFSSRGGELAKPDGISPGSAWSTVPPFLGRSVMAGTSMAAPQATGVHALLISAALQTDAPWSSGMVKHALKATAKPIRGYTVLDQGAGLIQVGPAWRTLRRMGRRANGKVLIDWSVETDVPHRPGETSTASLWRTGHYVPSRRGAVDVRVSAAFFEEATARERTEFFDTLTLKSDSRWVTLDRSRVAIRGERTEHLRLTLDTDVLERPGLHVAQVHATSGRTGVRAFTFPVTVVVPDRFHVTRTRTYSGTLAPGDVDRLFIAVPPGATAMEAEITTPEGRWGKTRLYVYDPFGREVGYARAHSDRGKEGRVNLAGDRLRPGIYELNPYGTFRNQDDTHYRVRVTFSGVESPDEVFYQVGEDGIAEAEITLMNRFDDAFEGRIIGRVIGQRKLHSLEISGDTSRTMITLSADMKGAHLRMTMSREAYATFTDVAINILDGEGEAVAQTGFMNRYAALSFTAPPGDYTLEIIGGQTTEDEAQDWSIEVDETHLFTAAVDLQITGPGAGAPTLYPNVPTPLTLRAEAALKELPDGYDHAARLRLTHAKDRATWLDVPLVLTR